MTTKVDHRLFPSIYTDGVNYFTVSDGQVWRWIRVAPTLFGDMARDGYWYAHGVKRMPADLRYACQAPAELQDAVKRKGGELHRYDLHKGQEHIGEEMER